MVTQLYTAPLRPYHAPSVGMGSSLPVKRQQGNLPPFDQDPSGGNEGSAGALAALQEQSRKGNISIQAILSDFQSTMDALNVPSETRGEILPYFQVVAHQAQKQQPSAPLIKQNLRGAAETLDQFISVALGQKSTVVREWVDALLLQSIDFHSPTPLALSPASQADTGSQTEAETKGLSLPERQSFAAAGLSVMEQERIRQALKDARLALKEQRFDTALGHYQEVLSRVRSAGLPETEGRLLVQMGRCLEKASRFEEAKTCYEQANRCLIGTAHSGLRARVNKALGMLFQKQGQLDKAIEHLQESLALYTLEQDESNQGVVLTQLGLAYSGQCQPKEARETFQQALAKAEVHCPKASVPILKYLGELSRQEGKRGQAFSYYKQSLTAARSQNNREGARQALQNIAALYLEANKPDKAFKALQNALYRL